MKIFLFFLLISLSVLAREKGPSRIEVGSSPVVSSAGLYLASIRGYFQEQGLQVSITDFNNSGASQIALLAKGQIDVGAGNLVSGVFNAINAGHRFKLVADKGHIEAGKDYLALIVRADHIKSGRYKTARDLKGFKMGVTALDGVSQQIVAERILIKNGLKPNDVEFIKLSYPEMNTALASKLIDATIQIEPFVTKAKLDGIADPVLSAAEVHPHQQSATIFFSENFMETRPKDAQKFMVAYLKGVRDYNRAFVDNVDRAKVVADLKKIFKIEDERIWAQMKTVGLNSNCKIDTLALSEDLNWYLEKKYISKIPSMELLVDDQFCLFALKKLGTLK